MSGVMFVFVALMLALFIAAIVVFFRRRRRVRPFSKLALVLGAVLLALEAALITANLDAIARMSTISVACIDLIVLARVIVFASVGMYFCMQAHRPGAPILQAILRRRRRTSSIPGRSAAVAVTAVVAGAVIYSYLLFAATSPQISERLRQQLEYQGQAGGLANEVSLVAVLAVLEFAFVEEIVFRLGIQSMLARALKLRGRAYWVAIFLTAAFWALGHAGTLEREWVKIAQIFPIGLALGALFRRFGVEACIIAHGVFNVVMTFVTPGLVHS